MKKFLKTMAVNIPIVLTMYSVLFMHMVLPTNQAWMIDIMLLLLGGYATFDMAKNLNK